MFFLGRTMSVGRVVVCVGVAILALAGSRACAANSEPDRPFSSFWSRVTVELPVLTRHIPNNDFDDHNWGAFVDVAVTRNWSMVGGDYVNSFHRHTAFAGVAYTPVSFDLGKVKIAPNAMVGLDLNGGYKGHNSVDPLLGAFQLSLTGAHWENTRYRILDRLGLAISIAPGSTKGHGSVPVNLALVYRFGD